MSRLKELKRQLKNYRMSLDSNQIEAVKFREGSAMVIAGPGSGKTTVLTNRVRYMIKELNIPPDEILVITFTKAAALQMKKRFEGMTDEYFPVTFSTFHSLFFSIINDASSIEVSLISPKEKFNILVSVLKEKNISFDAINLGSLLSEFSICSLNDDAFLHFESKYLEKDVFSWAFEAYQTEKKLLNKPDFDDFSGWANECLSNNPIIKKRWKERYRYCLIDEFQDISIDQYNVLKILFDNNIFAVGDDDQSIYGFRGAKPSVCFDFVKEYKAKVLYLVNNYRSNEKIVDRSAILISHNINRFDKKPVSKKDSPGEVIIKQYENSEEEYEELLFNLVKNKGEQKSNAILIRTNFVPEKLISEIVKEKIRIYFKDKPDSLLKNGFVKDILSYLKLSQKEYTYENLFRIVNKPNRYISRSFLTECKNRELTYDDTFTFKNLYSVAKGKSYIAGNIFKLETALKKIRDMDSIEAILYIFGVIGYEKFLRESGIKYTDVFDRLKMIAIENENISDFIVFCENIDKYMKDEMPSKEEFKAGNVVEIVTLHSSKGLEWDNVYIPDINEGNIPHRKSGFENIEEERRLLYVGMTRAKENLWMGCVKNDDEKIYPSPFVKELM